MIRSFAGLTRRVPFFYTSVTHVVGDRVGWVMSWFSLVPVFLMVSLATLVFAKGLTRHSREVTAYLFVGLLLNEVANHFLKQNVFEEPRPAETEKEDYGMPSDHAQFMTFLWVFRGHCKSLQVFQIPDLVWNLIFVLLILLVTFSRYYLDYHSPPQLVVGAFVGWGFGSFWSYWAPSILRIIRKWLAYWKLFQ